MGRRQNAIVLQDFQVTINLNCHFQVNSWVINIQGMVLMNAIMKNQTSLSFLLLLLPLIANCMAVELMLNANTSQPQTPLFAFVKKDMRYLIGFFLYFIQYLSLSGRWHTLLQRLWTWRLSFLWFIHIHSGLSNYALVEATDHYTLHGNRWPVPVQEREWLSWECQLWVWQAIQKIQVQVQKVVWGRWVVLLWTR